VVRSDLAPRRVGVGRLTTEIEAHVDSIATVKAVAQREAYGIDPDADFFGLTAANVGAGLLQGFSVDGSQSRSFTAADAGARSQMSSWVGAVLVLITLLVFTRPFEILPSATLRPRRLPISTSRHSMRSPPVWPSFVAAVSTSRSPGSRRMYSSR
jgi:hypothetical protein